MTVKFTGVVGWIVFLMLFALAIFTAVPFGVHVGRVIVTFWGL